MHERSKKIILFLLCLCLVALPLIIQGNLYFLGGDDMRLYYVFPEKYLHNFAFNIISDNTLGGANTGYYPTSQMAPVLYAILMFKRLFPFLNTQYLMYGLNYAFGFLFFYLFSSLWIKSNSVYSFFVKIIAAIFYICSPFLIGTLYRNQLMSMYLLSLMPFSLYLFSKAVLDKKYIYSVFVALIISIFSATLNTLPWSIPILVTGVPYLFYIFWSNKKSFILNITIFLFCFVALNIHWIFHFVNSNINNTGVAGSMNYFSTEEFKEENIRGILGVSRLLSPLDPVLVTLDYNFKQNFKLTDLKNIIFVVVIIFAGIHISRIRKKDIENLYFVSLVSYLASWFLFSPNLGNWGPNLFLKFATSLPYATMFRNMYDKFSLPLAFFNSFLLAISLIVLNQVKVGKTIKYLLLVFVFLVILSNAKYFITPRIYAEGATATVTGQFNDDFNNLINFINDLDNQSRVLWLPMTAPNYVNIEDKYYKEHFYSGLSPLRILAGRGDYAGRFAFMLPSDVFYGDKLIGLLKEGKYSEFVSNMQKMNARYIVVDNQDIPDYMKSYLYDSDTKYIEFQNETYKRVLLGKKLKDFGTRYSLYEINEKYLSDRLYLTDSYDEFPTDYTNLEYKKVKSYLYQVKISNLEVVKKLVFLDPYYKDWVLYLNNGKESIPFKKGENVLVNGWANGWEIDPIGIINNYDDSFYKLDQDGNMSLIFDLYFEPQKYDPKLYYFMLFSYMASGFTLAIYFLRIFIKKYIQHG